MLGEPLKTGSHLQDLVVGKTVSAQHIGQLRLAVCQSSCFVENERSAGSNLLQGCRILDDDAVPCGERDGSDDGHWNRQNERTWSGDDDHSQKTRGVTSN